MKYMCQTKTAQSLPVRQRLSQNATYQTNPNLYQHSNSLLPRLTLVVLRFLRVPLMVRTAFLAFLLVTFVASSASAARIVPTRPRAHATISKSAPHRARRSLHPAATS